MPAQRILVLTTEGDDREDGNVYYSRYYLVSATGSLIFDEPEFDGDADALDESGPDVLARLRGYGYEVTDPGVAIVALEEGNDLG